MQACFYHPRATAGALNTNRYPRGNIHEAQNAASLQPEMRAACIFVSVCFLFLLRSRFLAAHHGAQHRPLQPARRRTESVHRAVERRADDSGHIAAQKKAARIASGAAYLLAAVYAIVQYGAYLVLDRLLFISDFLYAGEGSDYLSYVMGFISPALLLKVGALLALGAAAVAVCPARTGRLWPRGGMAACALVGILLVPGLYPGGGDAQQWNAFDDPAGKYARFTNANFDMQLTGMYQYVVKDAGTQISRRLGAKKTDIGEIDAFFAQKPEHEKNDMTGVFAGKNLLIVMLESTDDWLITPEDTPTLHRMMSEGINFANLHTPQYSNGYTFNTEFAFSTSVYPYTNGNVAYNLTRTRLDHTMANAFRRAGYHANSFHMGEASFYNRGVMHQTFGYERYYSFPDDRKVSLDMYDDSYLLSQEALCRLMMPDEPFCSFFITISGHLPYEDADDLSRLALEKYPQYDTQEDRDVNILRAKTRLTDDLLAGLIARLEAENKLQHTAILCFTDHYAYGLRDKNRLRALSEEAGSAILERMPAFIWCAGYDQPTTVDRVMQITDLAPTVMNLFGFDVPREIMGQDVFDPSHPGIVVFPNNTWLTDKAYMKAGEIVYNHGMTEDEIRETNTYVQEANRINDMILDSDYYTQKAQN